MREEQRVTRLELFAELVFVLALTELRTEAMRDALVAIAERLESGGMVSGRFEWPAGGLERVTAVKHARRAVRGVGSVLRLDVVARRGS
jgi:hypothetical protein